MRERENESGFLLFDHISLNFVSRGPFRSDVWGSYQVEEWSTPQQGVNRQLDVLFWKVMYMFPRLISFVSPKPNTTWDKKINMYWNLEPNISRDQ